MLELLRRLAPLLGMPPVVVGVAEGVEDPLEVAYAVAGAMPLDLETRQQILELEPVDAKLRRLVDALQHEISVRELGQTITQRTQERLSKAQREAILREQLRSIQRELGEGDEGSELDALRHRVEEANPPGEARKEAERELDRLSAIPEASPEHGLIRTWLEWVGDLPWRTLTGGDIDVEKARAVLDEDHYDLEQVKDRILEHLAVRKLRRERGADVGLGGGVGEGVADGWLEGEPSEGAEETVGETSGPGGAATPQPTTPEAESAREPILCFVGPPGVGKTSLGQSIARALGRKFVRMSLGGIHDEAEIRGHRRTYIGAMPGRIVQALRRAGARDPVFMLDEIDKLGADFRGDPSAALLEVLDPAQNHAFTDTTWACRSTCRRCCSSRPRTRSTRSPGRCSTAWRCSGSPGTPTTRRSRSRARYLVPQQLQAHGLRAGRADDRRRRDCARSFAATRARPACAIWSGEIAQRLPQGGARVAEGKADAAAASRARRTTSRATSGRRRFFDEVGGARSTARAWRPGWPGPRPAARCCSSRRR